MYYEPEDDFQVEVQGKEYLLYFMALNIVYYYQVKTSKPRISL